MEASARYAICVGLTNIPQKDEWEPLIRLCKLLKGSISDKNYIKILNNLKKREPYAILEIIGLLSLDHQEYDHLKLCLYKNEMAKTGCGNADVNEIHVEKEYWRVAQLDNNRR